MLQTRLAETQDQQEPKRWDYLLPMPIGLADRIGIWWFCKRYNCNLDFMSNGECRFHNTNGLFRPSPGIETVRLTGWGRFGNAVVQLVNAFRVAKRFRADTVQFAKEHPYLTGTRSGPFALEVSPRPREGLTLEGRFFFLKPFPFRKGSPKEVAHVIRELVRPILAPSILSPHPGVGDDDLVLHFRGGDVFSDDLTSIASGHLYGQPPLSFYLAAVEREQPTRVWLISEDDRNPCMQAAMSALVAEGLRRRRMIVVVRHHGDLTEDIRIIMSARTLVASRGSFAYAIAHLSKRLQRAYFFEAKTYLAEAPSLPILRKLGVHVVDTRDADGDYRSRMFRRNWANSPNQRDLMLSYPLEKLRFEDRPSNA